MNEGRITPLNDNIRFISLCYHVKHNKFFKKVVFDLSIKITINFSKKGTSMQKTKILELYAYDTAKSAAFYGGLLNLEFHEREFGFESSRSIGAHIIHIRQNTSVEGSVQRPTMFTLELPELLSAQHWMRERRLFTPFQLEAIETSEAELWYLTVRDIEGNAVILIKRPQKLFHDIQRWLFGRAEAWIDHKLILRALSAKVVDRWRYERDSSNILVQNLDGYTHLVTSREGLFAASRNDSVKVLDGMFFGLTHRDDTFYLFEANDLNHASTNRGRIIRLKMDGTRVQSSDVVVKGLDNGCHQIEFIGDHLYICDTYNQRVIRYDSDLKPAGEFYPLGKALKDDYTGNYVNFNSIVGRGDRIYLLLHNGLGSERSHQSEVVEFSLDFQEVGRYELPGFGCHDLVFLEDGRLLSCDSGGGRIVDAMGEVATIGHLLTRGLSVGDSEIVVGDSFFSVRKFRRYVPGHLHFFDRDFKRQGSLALSAAPTEVRRLDGQDLAISNYAESLR